MPISPLSIFARKKGWFTHMNKKRLSLIIFTVLLAVLLLGCGANGGDADADGFPDLLSFTAQTLDGDEFTAADFADADLTMINIWGTYCGPCLREMPELAQLANSLPDNVRIMTYCIDAADNVETARDILKDAGFDGVTLIDGDGDLEKLLQTLQYIPTTVFVDSEGRQVGEAAIGSPENVAEFYTNAINAALSSIGKDAI
ncbi:MAG: TlpA family protein disulfide reductase [Firmicutes bacterium]|nr:TlpA family protein disulfide reductase [Bacillota bacterium]